MERNSGLVETLFCYVLYLSIQLGEIGQKSTGVFCWDLQRLVIFLLN